MVWRAVDPQTGEELVDEGDERRYLEARPGDTLFCPFECDDCSFRRVTGRWPEGNPHLPDPKERFLLDLIRRANLDAFWSREPGTIADLLRLFKEQAQLGVDLGYPAFGSPGPMPQGYDGGMRVAIGVLYKSLQPGRHEKFLKFSSARKARSVFTNVFLCSEESMRETRALRADKVRTLLSSNPTDAEFFSRFIKGVEARVGQRVKRDMAISIEIMLEFERMTEERWVDACERGDQSELRQLAEWGSYFSCTFCHSLRGWETVLARLESLRAQIVDESKGRAMGVPAHFGLPLYGRFKRCGNANVELLCMIAAETSPGLKPLKWVNRLIGLIDDAGGPRSDWLFQKQDGSRRVMGDFAPIFYDMLRLIQEGGSGLVPDDEEVSESYFLSRSFRRGATTRAQVAGVQPSIVEWVNRWGTGKEAVVKGAMRVVYSEKAQMLEHFLTFSRAL